MLKKLSAAGVAAAAVTGALLLAAPANAGEIGTSGAGGILSGNQVVAPITAPINVCGNSVAVVGGALAGCKGGASVGGGHRHRPPCHHHRRPPCHHRPWSSS
ncbi:chaplin [Actinoallomurus spadix]|uniref:Chaplin domain-containing protein n=1 Tax=Actinoallomurus spadix TaxID=79912 RepID=A0ABP3G5Q3_9ACTN|nr:chaplin family protein [Actinoallomurus spadix]MCO5987296.1 chaplin [Actinoallomurus spadix]